MTRRWREKPDWVRDIEVMAETVRLQNSSNPSIRGRKARRAFVGQVVNLRPRPGGTRQSACRPSHTAAQAGYQPAAG